MIGFNFCPGSSAWVGGWMKPVNVCSALPKPKSSGTTGGALQEEELEEIVKAKPAELALKEMLPTKKTRKIVQITIPALQVPYISLLTVHILPCKKSGNFWQISTCSYIIFKC